MRTWHFAGPTMGLVTLLACQDYALVYQRDRLREGVHVRFAVSTPSQVDFLMVVDNSWSMVEEQRDLAAAFSVMVEELSGQATDYRIGITSTDVSGSPVDCCNEPIPASASAGPGGNKGSCATCTACSAADPADRCRVVLRRPPPGSRTSTESPVPSRAAFGGWALDTRNRFSQPRKVLASMPSSRAAWSALPPALRTWLRWLSARSRSWSGYRPGDRRPPNRA